MANRQTLQHHLSSASLGLGPNGIPSDTSYSEVNDIKDVCVIGGGVNGAGIACDAAERKADVLTRLRTYLLTDNRFQVAPQNNQERTSS